MESIKGNRAKHIGCLRLSAAIIVMAAVLALTGTAEASHSLSFDGVDDFVDCGQGPQITGNAPRTIEAWAYTHSFDDGGIFQAGKWGWYSYDEGFSLRTLTEKDRWRVQLGAYYDLDVTLPGSLNQWHHYAMTYDGATVKLYYDGVLAGSKSVDLDTGAHDLWFGRWENHYFNGLIDEVRVWNTALDKSIIAAWKNRPLTSSHPNHEDLAAHYPMDEGAGGTASDLGGGNDGTLQNGPIWSSFIPSKTRFLSFDGSNDYVYCDQIPEVAGDAPRTIEAWAYVRSFNHGGIFQAGPTGAEGRDFSLRTLTQKDRWRVQLWGPAFDLDVTLPGGLNRWRHYAMTYDGDTVRLYYDGVLAGSKSVDLDTGAHDFRIGRWRDDYFDGMIDEVRVWNAALSQSTIADWDNRPVTPSHPNYDDLAAYYPLDEGAGTTTSDIKGTNHGTLANDPTWSSTSPSLMATPSMTPTRSIAVGGFHSLTAKPDGRVFAWGNNEYGQLGDGTMTQATAVSAGRFHSLALKSDGTVWAWGDNRYGQLGDDATTNRTEPVQVSGLTDVVSIDAGGFHNLALKSDGTVWAWGYNGAGTLGDGTEIHRHQPVQVANLSDVTAISAGAYHSLAVKSDGTVWSWGSNYYNQLGDRQSVSTNIPSRVKNISSVKAVSGGGSHTLALKSDGTVWSWGDNRRGQLGDGSQESDPTPRQVLGLDGVVEISAGGTMSMARLIDGTVWAWGGGFLGDGNFHGIYSLALHPIRVPEIDDAIAVAARGLYDWTGHKQFNLVWDATGRGWSWGNNDAGQLGNGTTTDQTQPVAVLSSEVVVKSPPTTDALTVPGTADHPLYHLTLTPDEDVDLTGVAFKTGGTYLTDDLTEFQLRYSEDEILDADDPVLDTLPSKAPGTRLSFTGLSQAMSGGADHHLFLTADIASDAGGARTVRILAPSDADITFSPKVILAGTAAPGGVQTFESAVVTVSSSPVDETTALQGVSDHPLYRLELSVDAGLDTILTGLKAVMAGTGTYATSDVDGFALRFSEDNILDADDPELSALEAIGPGGALDFTGFSRALPAGGVGYLFITVDVAETIETGRTIQVTPVAFDDIGFKVDPEKVGSDPTAAGPVHTLYAIPKVAVSTPEIPADRVAQGTADYPLYKLVLEASDNDTILTGLKLAPDGTYTASDVDRFRLYTSDDAVLDGGDTLLATLEPPLKTLSFTGLDLPVNRGETIHLIVTADINEDAEGTHTLYIKPLALDDLVFDPPVTQASSAETLLAGGVQTFPISPYTAMSAGFYHTLALKKNGTVWAWGNNENGQLGEGTTEDSVIALPVSELAEVVDTAAGDYFSLALKSDGTVWAWGQNDVGQLGDGTRADRTTAVRVSGLTNVRLPESGGPDHPTIAAGDTHCVALKADGTVWTWGGNRYGQLGDGTTSDSITPLRVSSLTEIVAVAAGGGRSMALSSDGTVWAWGQNDFGQLGDNTTENRSYPVRVSGLPGIAAIAAGDYHSLALTDDGDVYAWGGNENGQLGDESFVDRKTPTPVSGISDAEAVAAGNRHSLALLSDGTVRAWGWNAYGQLGDGGGGTDQPVPVQVTVDGGVEPLSGIVAIEAGGDFSQALGDDGAILAWGHNAYGQLGDGTLEDQTHPVPGGIIPAIRITAREIPEGVVTRGVGDQVLYRLQMDVSDADATLSQLVLTTGGDYETSDLSGEFRLYYSEDETFDSDDAMLDSRTLRPPNAAIRFLSLDRPIPKGTTCYLFVAVDIAPEPVVGRNVFIDALPLADIGFAERNVYRSGEDPLPASGPQYFPALTVAAASPDVGAAELAQNAQDQVIYRLNLSVTDGDDAATLTGLTLTTGGDYRMSDIAGKGFKLRYSEDDSLDDGDPTLGLVAAAPGDRLVFKGLAQPVTASGAHLFLTADVSAVAGGGRTLFIEETRLSRIEFAESFVAKTGSDPLAAGAAMTFPMAVIEAEVIKAAASEEWVPVEQSAVDHILYQIKLTVEKSAATLAGLTLTPEGDYAEGDIVGFRLFYSENDVLETETDPILAEHAVVPSGTELVFEGLSRRLPRGTGYLFLTADIDDFAVVRTISIAETPLDRFTFTDDVTFEPDDALDDSESHTFPTPEVTIESTPLPATTVEQDTPAHPLYRIDLTAADARVVLNDADFVTAGAYIPADIDRFHLRYSEDDTLDGGDAGVGIHETVPSGGTLSFSDFSLVIEKGTTGHLFVTADIGAANGGRTLRIAETPFDSLVFREPDNIEVSGTDPLPEGAVTTLPLPDIVLSAPEVAAETIEQEIANLVIYRIDLAITRAEAVLKSAEFTTAGTYRASDLVSETPFKLRYSPDESLDPTDPTLGAVDFVEPGGTLTFTGMSETLPKDNVGHLFLTADIDRANGARTLFIPGIGPDALAFEFGNVSADPDPLADGGVQTFPVPAITIAAPPVPDAVTERQVDNHILYRFSLSVERAEAVLEGMTLRTGGTYLPSDLSAGSPFKLWYSGNPDFNTGDTVLATVGFIDPGGDLVFDDLSRMIDKRRTGHFFITVDIGEAVGRHIFIAETPFDRLAFMYNDKCERFGTDPAPAGGKQQFPIPEVDIASAGVAPATVEPRATDHLLYRMRLSVTEADAILDSLRLPMGGFYRASEIRTDCVEMDPCTPEVELALPVFKLWYSEDDILEFEEDGPPISDSLFVASGETLRFDNLDRTIPENDAGHLFVTANIGPAVPDRTVYVKEVPFSGVVLGYREKSDADPAVVKRGTDPLAAGGAQTIADTPGSLLAMDGVEDYLDVPYAPDLNPDAFTVSIKASVAAQQDVEGNAFRTRQTIVSSIDEAAVSGYEFFVDEDNKLKMRIGTDSGWVVIEGPEVIDNRFYDITGAYDENRAVFYVDGESFGAKETAGFVPNASAPLQIGTQPDGDSDLNGRISEVHVWNIARTPEAIAESIETPPTDNEEGIVAHYRFTPWGTLVDTTGLAHDGTIEGDPMWVSALSGLWVGQIEIDQVNEGGFGAQDTETPYDVSHPFDMRILLHVDARDAILLLRRVTLMQKPYTIETGDGEIREMARRILVTDDDQLYRYQGVVRRDGELTGIRLGSLFFDFDPAMDELPVDGKIRAGGALSGDLTLSADHPRNPFRHRYHPDHRSGRDIHRSFTLTIDPGIDVLTPTAGSLDLTGTYEEMIEGLHKLPVRMRGTFKLERVSIIPLLNDGE